MSILVNLGRKPFMVERGLRIAQLVIAATMRAIFAKSQDSMKPHAGSWGFWFYGHRGRGRRADRPPELYQYYLMWYLFVPTLAASPPHALLASQRHPGHRRRHRHRAPWPPVRSRPRRWRNPAPLPPRHLEPVLQALVRHGILKGIRGPRGGYE